MKGAQISYWTATLTIDSENPVDQHNMALQTITACNVDYVPLHSSSK